MPTWTQTRLAVIVDGDTANPISPIETFSPTFSLATEVIHSLEATHIGYVANPDSFTFSMTVKAIGGGAGRLTELALAGTEFTVGLYKAADVTADEWDFDHVLFSKCIITSATPSTGTISGAPTATFSGVARQVEASVGGAVSSLPSFTA
jgi:hypothetical protein